MKSLYFFLVVSISLPQSIKTIPFDWAQQFGYVNYCGSIFWNQDWRSKRLLFDGTWAIYPEMFGTFIEDGFMSEVNKLKLNDHNNIESHFVYDQGDYSLDQFTLGFESDYGSRHLMINGFKRSYVGNFNQYNNNTYQPNQQSYLISYQSLTSLSHSGVTIGHFNTLSGFPDEAENGLFTNKITSLNLFNEQKLNDFKVKFMMDQFLQIYNPLHSLSFTFNPRYLNRSQLLGELEYAKSKLYSIRIGAISNSRDVQTLNKSLFIKWSEIYSEYNLNFLSIGSGIIFSDNARNFEYKLGVTKDFQKLKLKCTHSLKNSFIHPYYMLNHDFNHSLSITKKYLSTIELGWIGPKSNLSFELVHTNGDKKFWNSLIQRDSILKVDFLQTNINVDKILFLNNNLNINLMLQDNSSIYSGGIGQILAISISSNFQLFDKFLNLRIKNEFQHFSKRRNGSYINPIEMIPIIENSGVDIDVAPFHFLNSSIEARVSTFIISFEWKNITEIFLSSIDSKKDNFIMIHPYMPELGRQMKLKIEWQFFD